MCPVKGTLINAGAVLVGGFIGLIVHTRLPDRIARIVFQGIGLFTLFLGITMAIKANNFLVMVFSVVPGSIVGELLNIEGHMNRLGAFVKSKIGSKDDRFAEGFVTAFLLFCMGSMTILGAIEEGLGGKPNLLLAKSVLDGFSSIALSASLGIGVVLSAVPLLIYQGGISLFASSLHHVLTPRLVTEVTAVGGLLLMGLGLNILKIASLSILNMLPSLIIVAIISCFLY
jgi:uncharacterized protein